MGRRESGKAFRTAQSGRERRRWESNPRRAGLQPASGPSGAASGGSTGVEPVSSPSQGGVLGRYTTIPDAIAVAQVRFEPTASRSLRPGGLPMLPTEPCESGGSRQKAEGSKEEFSASLPSAFRPTAS